MGMATMESEDTKLVLKVISVIGGMDGPGGPTDHQKP